jgi:hypothetical protein
MEVIQSHPMYGEEYRHSSILPLLAHFYFKASILYSLLRREKDEHEPLDRLNRCGIFGSSKVSFCFVSFHC